MQRLLVVLLLGLATAASAVGATHRGGGGGGGAARWGTCPSLVPLSSSACCLLTGCPGRPLPASSGLRCCKPHCPLPAAAATAGRALRCSPSHSAPFTAPRAEEQLGCSRPLAPCQLLHQLPSARRPHQVRTTPVQLRGALRGGGEGFGRWQRCSSPPSLAYTSPLVCPTPGTTGQVCPLCLRGRRATGGLQPARRRVRLPRVRPAVRWRRRRHLRPE